MVNMFILFLMIASACAVGWPDESYSLPKPKSGCPTGWAMGFRNQDNEDTHNINSVTPPDPDHHFDGYFGRNTIMCYCTKTTYSGYGSWPSGNYCIARYGGSCPLGFTCNGSIYWDDEDDSNANSKWGVLPDGEYGRNTKIYYCCRSDRSAYSYIDLPAREPFYLYKYTSTCQRVRGMNVTEESVKMDDEDSMNNSSDDGCHPKKTDTTVVHYCYYS
uniref:Nacre apextrin-like protein 1 n=1 Tax=Mytilus galloprovincialis TaxID=29158 RepID=A0A0K0PV08_MYTGA|nr:nacre apextrin-like protein 1 [Mytilus galloprovincialis]